MTSLSLTAYCLFLEVNLKLAKLSIKVKTNLLIKWSYYESLVRLTTKYIERYLLTLASPWLDI